MSGAPSNVHPMVDTQLPLLRVVPKDGEAAYPRCSLGLRLLARAFDLCIAWGLYVAGAKVGPVLAVLFLLFADAFLPAGQSIGKRVFGIRVVHLPTRSSARSRESVLRNGPFGLTVLLSMMPQPIGTGAFLLAAIVMGAFELFRLLRDTKGRRWGDLWAETQVVDGKVAIDESSPVMLANESRSPGRLMAAARQTLRLKSGRSTRCASR